MKYLYAFAGGRSMTAFWVLLAIGAVLAFRGQLTGHYVALAGTLHAFVIVRAVSEDKFCEGKTAGA
jgi:hypothetical protein